MTNKQLFNILVNYAKQEGVTIPIQFGIKLCKVANRGMTRYMRVYIGNVEVTDKIIAITGRKMSKARDLYGTIIQKGCGMDMGFELQSKIYSCACQEGMQQYIDPSIYRLIER